MMMQGTMMTGNHRQRKIKSREIFLSNFTVKVTDGLNVFFGGISLGEVGGDKKETLGDRRGKGDQGYEGRQPIFFESYNTGLYFSMIVPFVNSTLLVHTMAATSHFYKKLC